MLKDMGSMIDDDRDYPFMISCGLGHEKELELLKYLLLLQI
jgi:hypothetical protein